MSKVFIFHKTHSEIDKMLRVITGFHFAWFCSHRCFHIFLIPSALKFKDSNHKTEDFFLFLEFLYSNVCHYYQDNLCHNLHELFGLPQGILTHDYVVHASIIRFSVSIDVYCSTCLSVLWNKTNVTQCTHSNFVKCVYHSCLYILTDIYTVR